MYICNPRSPTVRWETEIRETLEALGPASLVYAAANNKESALNKVRGKDCRHTRLFSDLHMSAVAHSFMKTHTSYAHAHVTHRDK